MLQLKNVSYRVNDRVIIDDQSLDVQPAEMLAMVGPSGSGKSTLMGLLSGRLHASAGEACLDGRCLSSWSPATLSRRRAVLSPQAQLTFGVNASDVVALGCGQGRDGQPSEETIQQVMSLVKVNHLSACDYRSLSTAEQQRVQFARTLAQVWEASVEPAWLLLDAPFMGFGLGCDNIILQVAKWLVGRGYGVVVALNNLNKAIRYADRVALLNKGSVVCAGSPMEVLESNCWPRVYGITLKRTSGSKNGTVHYQSVG